MLSQNMHKNIMNLCSPLQLHITEINHPICTMICIYIEIHLKKSKLIMNLNHLCNFLCKPLKSDSNRNCYCTDTEEYPFI